MRIWHPSLWKYLDKQFLGGLNKEFGTLTGSHIRGYNHSTVQYLLDDEIEKVIALRIKFYDFIVENGIFNISHNAGAYNYINGNVGFSSDIDISKVIKYYNKDKIYSHHNDEYLLECLNNLWGKMTGSIKHDRGHIYSDNIRQKIWNMFLHDDLWWFVNMKIDERLEEVK